MTWIRQLFTRQRIEADLAAEIREHLEEKVDELVASGVPRETAIHQARREFGNVTLIEERARDVWRWRWIEDFFSDVRLAARTLRKSPGFAIVAILTLAIGTGANTAIFSVADASLLSPLPFPQPDQLVTVNEIVPVIGNRPIRLTAPDLVDYQEQTHSFDDVAGWTPHSFELSGERESERVQAIRATASLFRVLQVMPALGRTFSDEEDRSGTAVCVISAGLWRRWFGADPGVVGRVIHLDRQPYEVVGVMPRRFDFPLSGMTDGGVATDLWVPMSLTPKEREARGDNWSYNGIARMKAAVTVDQASADVNAVAQHILRDVLPSEWRRELAFTALVRPLTGQVSAGVRPLVQLLLGAVALVLLVACVNVAHLLLTRGTRREKEIAMRVALGATRGRVFRQLASETLVLVVVAAAVGALLAWWATHTLVRAVPPALAVLGQATFNWRVLLFAFGLTAVTALLVGTIPGIVAATRLRGETLKQPGASASGVRYRRMRSALVVTEVAVAVVLLVGAGLLMRSFRDLLSASGGFEPEGAVAGYISLPTNQYPDAVRERAFFRELHDRLQALPSIAFAGIGTTLPLSGRRSERVFTPSDYIPPPGPGFNIAGMTVVNSEYLQAIGATLVHGRSFTPQDNAAGEPVAVVTESIARRYWAGQDPIGRRVMWGSPKAPRPWLTVVGVVGDVKLDALDRPGGPQIYVPADQVEYSTGNTVDQLRSMYVVVRGRGSADSLSAGLRQAVQGLDPQLAVAKLQALTEIRDASTAPERFNMVLMSGFAALALLLATIGIYGVVAHSVAQRTQEISVRVALGADTTDVVTMIVRGGVGLALTGAAIGSAAAAGLAPTLSSLLFGIAPLDPPTFAGVTILLLLVAAIATYIPARRAASIDPMVALRSE
jgi:putative ABC transport system permease protein